MGYQVATFDLDRDRQWYANLTRAGQPVLPWPDYEAAARDLKAASEDLGAAILDVDAFINDRVPAGRRIYPLYHVHHGPEVEAAHNLLLSDRLPLPLGPSDFRFQTAYGKSRRNPLGHMAARTKQFRAAVDRLRSTIARLKAAEEPR